MRININVSVRMGVRVRVRVRVRVKEMIATVKQVRYSIVSDIIPLFMQVPRAHHQLSLPRGYRHTQQVKIL